MGSLRRFNLKKLIRKYNTTYFFETGTWRGDGVTKALKSGFENIVSSEIIPEIAEEAKKKFTSNNNVEIICGDSISVMKDKLTEIKGNCFFWLDAHYPGAEEGMKDYNETEDENIRLPLEKELELIKQTRAQYDDVIFIDDLRIYEKGDYAQGNVPDHILPPSIRNIDFVYRNFCDTHTIVKSFRDEGYLLLFPIRSFAKGGICFSKKNQIVQATYSRLFK